MKNVTDFLSAALPWIIIGLTLAVFFVKADKRKKSDEDEREEDYGTEGMCIGMCIGAAIDVHYGLSLGMLLGYAIGSCIKKDKKEDDDD